MITEEIERLKFRRQYVLSPKSIHCPFQYQRFDIAGLYTLYAHTDLHVATCGNNSKRIWLLGDMFDYQSPEQGNEEILTDLIGYDLSQFMAKVGDFAGRYVLFFYHDGEIHVLHDCFAAKKVFYSSLDSGNWLSSHPNLLAKVLGLKPTENEEMIRYYQSEDFLRLNSSNIGNTTRYDEIRQLMPNHCLQLSDCSVNRYWPDRKFERKPPKEIAHQASAMIEGYMKSITNRFNVMLPVTAGKDSRMLLAGTKNLTNKVFYYINREHRLNSNSPDIRVPKKLLTNLGLKFHIIDPNMEIDEDFRRVYFENNEFASDFYLPLIYNYYRNFSDRVNLPGNIVSGAIGVIAGNNVKPKGKIFAGLYHLSQYSYAIQYYDEWISGCLDLCTQNNISLISLFYMEERIANWGAQVQLEKDIAQEDINPFNSRSFTTLILSTHPKNIVGPNYRMQKQIMKNLWPEVLKSPINPSTRTNLKKVSHTIGLLQLYKKLKYLKINRL
jgi:hypothetical protein